MAVCKAFDTGLELSEIDRSHRIGKPKSNGPRDILVKFATYRSRQKLYAKRTGLKDEKLGYRGTFINEHLTRSKLLFAARNMAKDGKILSAWSFDGNIFIKVRDPDMPENLDDDAEIPTKIVRIMSFVDLEPYRT